MNKFVFRPQVLIEIQKRKVEHLQEELALAQQKLMDIDNKLSNLNQELTEALLKRDESMKTGMAAGDLCWYTKYLERLQREVENTQTARNKQEKECDEIKFNLSEAVKYKKTLEKYREIRYNEYKQIIHKAETRQMDEIAVVSYIRNNDNT